MKSEWKKFDKKKRLKKSVCFHLADVPDAVRRQHCYGRYYEFSISKNFCSPFINLILALLNIQAGNTAVLWCAYSFGGNSNSFPLTLNFMRIRYLLLRRKKQNRRNIAYSHSARLLCTEMTSLCWFAACGDTSAPIPAHTHTFRLDCFNLHVFG